jgi:hypothetical protein
VGRGILRYCQWADYMALNGRMIDEWQIRKDFKGNSHDMIKVLSWHLPGRTEENHKEPRCG